MQQVSRTGILFLVYSKSPNATIFNFTDSILVLGDTGAVIYNGFLSFDNSLLGSIAEAKRTLYDPYFDPQPNYNSMDCLYHLVINPNSIHSS